MGKTRGGKHTCYWWNYDHEVALNFSLPIFVQNKPWSCMNDKTEHL